MEFLNKKTDTTVATLIHLSTFSKYLIPFGNFFFPLILWTAEKKNPFVDENAKKALNFQISLFLYAAFILGAALASLLLVGYRMNLEMNIGPETFYVSDGEMLFPFMIILAVTGILLLGMLVLDIISSITATMKASEGILYTYPLTIAFLKSSNQSKNEQFNNNVKNETL